MDTSNMSIAELKRLRQKEATLKSIVDNPELRFTLVGIIKAFDIQIGELQEAVANVLDKVEHGHSEGTMITRYSKIAGVTERALEVSLAEKRAELDREKSERHARLALKAQEA